MVTVTTCNKTKQLTWTNGGHLAFERLKVLVNVCSNCALLITLNESFCTLTLRTMPMGRIFPTSTLPNEGVVEELIRFLGGAYFMDPRHVGQPSKKRHTPFIGPFFVWMTWLAEYTSRYERITGTCCSWIIMAPGRCYNGSSIFNTTTQRLNMSQVRITFLRTCSADWLCRRHQSKYIIS
jgi:hypothetical protein